MTHRFGGLLVAMSFVIAACSSTPVDPTPTSQSVAPSVARATADLPSPSAQASPSPSPSPDVPTQEEVVGAVGRWLSTTTSVRLPTTVYVLTGASSYEIGFEQARPTLLTTGSRSALSQALGISHHIVFVDDPLPLIPSPYPDYDYSWSYPNDGALLGLLLNDLEPDTDRLGVKISINRGADGSDGFVTVARRGSTYEVVDVGNFSSWIT